MAGKQAKTLTRAQFAAALRRGRPGRHGVRNRVIFLLSTKAGLRAGEIAKLTWPMLLGTERDWISRVDLAVREQGGMQ